MSKQIDECEMRDGPVWTRVDIEEALGSRGEDMRCPECHGRLQLHREYIDGARAHFEHRAAHDGCSTKPPHLFRPPVAAPTPSRLAGNLLRTGIIVLLQEGMLKRLKALEARAIVAEELERAGWDTASTFTVGDGARPGTGVLSWWHENTPLKETSETQRSIAYLRAYLRIGGEKLYAGGIFLDRRRLWMDRSVISRLERDGYIAFQGEGTREPYFVLTEKGRQLIY